MDITRLATTNSAPRDGGLGHQASTGSRFGDMFGLAFQHQRTFMEPPSSTENSEVGILSALPLTTEGSPVQSFELMRPSGVQSIGIRGMAEQLASIQADWIAARVGSESGANSMLEIAFDSGDLLDPVMSPTRLAHHGEATTRASAPLPLTVGPEVGANQWDQSVGQKILWMVSGDLQVADLQLNPPELGPLQVRLNMSDGGASLSFASQHSAVRDALEAAMPRLREMMEQTGISLLNVNVSDRDHARQSNSEHTASSLSPDDNEAQSGSESDIELPRNSMVSVHNGLLDVYI